MKKKYFALLLALVMLVMSLTVTATAYDDDDLAPTSAGTLKVSVNGENATEVSVGDYFVVRVGLYAGDKSILNGQVHVGYDSAKASFVPVKGYCPADDAQSEEGYCFLKSISGASPVMNYGNAGVINYNFSKAKGTEVFNDTEKLFARFCFKATAAGSMDIDFTIQYMINADETKIYYKSQPNAEINPYIVAKIIKYYPNGDVNADGKVNGGDSGILSRYYAGWDGYADRVKNMDGADFTRDGKINGADTGNLARYASGWEGYNKYLDIFPA